MIVFALDHLPGSPRLDRSSLLVEFLALIFRTSLKLGRRLDFEKNDESFVVEIQASDNDTVSLVKFIC